MRPCVVVPAYEAGPWIGRCVRSIRRQSGADLRCVVIDDASADDTFARARAGAEGDARIEVVRNSARVGALANLLAGARRLGDDPEDVIVTVDGDDWLRTRGALARVRAAYADPDVWLTYGSHQRWKDRFLHRIGWTVRRGIAAPYPPEVVAARGYRTHPFLASHLRTFKRFLLDAIDDADLRDEDGDYYRVGGDVAHMVPMLEMAGPAHVRFLPDLLYVYNNSNPINDHRAHAAAQRRVTERVAQGARYALLERPR